MLIHAILLFSCVLLSSLIGTWVVRHFATRYGWVARPRQDRWHQQSTALHGGVGFFPAFLLGALCVLLWQLFPQGLAEGYGTLSSPNLLGLALVSGAFFMFITGWLDDIHPLKPVSKLLAEIAAASVFIAAGGVLEVTAFDLLNVFISYFWFLGLINGVNMLDNMDGLASGLVIIATATLVILSWYGPTQTVPLMMGLLLSLMAALLGFWFFNKPPATIFMGDSGSLFIGYVLAALAIPSELNGFFGIVNIEKTVGPVMTLLIPAAVMVVPIFDTTLVTISRRWRGRKVSVGGKDHTSHRMVLLGLSERRAVWVLYAFSVLGSMVAVLMMMWRELSVTVLGVFVLILGLSGVYLGKVHIQEEAPAKTNRSIGHQLIENLLHKRYIAILLMDWAIVVVCYYAAYLLRFDGHLPAELVNEFVLTVPLVIPVCLAAFMLFGVYRSQWYLMSVADLSRCFWGVLGGVLSSFLVIASIVSLQGMVSLSVLIIFAILLLLVLIGSRLSFRFLDHLIRASTHHRQQDRQPVVVYGAGRGGKLLAEEVYTNALFQEYRVLGFIDDDARKQGKHLQGLPIRSASDWQSIFAKEFASRPLEIWVSSRFIDTSCVRHWLKDQNISLRRLSLSLDQEKCLEEVL
jgi:UDP-GlcNAc:undecaprenyl-phosphate/decaprenyl-phosphate GlcNAc-1-phosphate transferase